MNKSKLKISAFLLLIFVAGAMSGAAIAWKRASMHRDFPRPGWNKGGSFKPPTTDEMVSFVLKDWKEKLDLTDEQTRQIQPLLHDGIEYVRQIQMKSVEEVREAMSKGDARVAEFLTPDQKVKFEQMQKERARFGPGPGHHGGHPPGGHDGPPPGPPRMPPPDRQDQKPPATGESTPSAATSSPGGAVK